MSKKVTIVSLAHGSAACASLRPFVYAVSLRPRVFDVRIFSRDDETEADKRGIVELESLTAALDSRKGFTEDPVLLLRPGEYSRLQGSPEHLIELEATRLAVEHGVPICLVATSYGDINDVPYLSDADVRRAVETVIVITEKLGPGDRRFTTLFPKLEAPERLIVLDDVTSHVSSILAMLAEMPQTRRMTQRGWDQRAMLA